MMGGAAESVTSYLRQRYAAGLSRDEALRLTVAALGHNDSGDRRIPAGDLEVAVLDRTRTQTRKFRRQTEAALVALLEQASAGEQQAAAPEAADAGPAHSISPGEEPPVAP